MICCYAPEDKALRRNLHNKAPPPEIPEAALQNQYSFAHSVGYCSTAVTPVER